VAQKAQVNRRLHLRIGKWPETPSSNEKLGQMELLLCKDAFGHCHVFSLPQSNRIEATSFTFE
jgi:hypothetical protein